jgi:hypothetical protein
MRAIPLKERLFRFDEAPFFRLEIVVDGSGTPVKLRGLYSDGHTDESPRS